MRPYLQLSLDVQYMILDHLLLDLFFSRAYWTRWTVPPEYRCWFCRELSRVSAFLRCQTQAIIFRRIELNLYRDSPGRIRALAAALEGNPALGVYTRTFRVRNSWGANAWESHLRCPTEFQAHLAEMWQLVETMLECVQVAKGRERMIGGVGGRPVTVDLVEARCQMNQNAIRGRGRGQLGTAVARPRAPILAPPESSPIFTFIHTLSLKAPPPKPPRRPRGFTILSGGRVRKHLNLSRRHFHRFDPLLKPLWYPSLVFPIATRVAGPGSSLRSLTISIRVSSRDASYARFAAFLGKLLHTPIRLLKLNLQGSPPGSLLPDHDDSDSDSALDEFGAESECDSEYDDDALNCDTQAGSAHYLGRDNESSQDSQSDCSSAASMWDDPGEDPTPILEPPPQPRYNHPPDNALSPQSCRVPTALRRLSYQLQVFTLAMEYCCPELFWPRDECELELESRAWTDLATYQVTVFNGRNLRRRRFCPCGPEAGAQARVIVKLALRARNRMMNVRSFELKLPGKLRVGFVREGRPARE